MDRLLPCTAAGSLWHSQDPHPWLLSPQQSLELGFSSCSLIYSQETTLERRETNHFCLAPFPCTGETVTRQQLHRAGGDGQGWLNMDDCLAASSQPYIGRGKRRLFFWLTREACTEHTWKPAWSVLHTAPRQAPAAEAIWSLSHPAKRWGWRWLRKQTLLRLYTSWKSLEQAAKVSHQASDGHVLHALLPTLLAPLRNAAGLTDKPRGACTKHTKG